MTYRMRRASGRPSRSATKTIMVSNSALPRSGSAAHCTPLARGTGPVRDPGTASSGSRTIGNEHSVGDRLAFPQDTEADRAVRQALLSEGERLSRMHRADELRPADPPASAASAFDDAHHLIEQHYAGKNRRVGKVAGKRRVLGGDGESRYRVHSCHHAGVADFACAASDSSAVSGSLPVSLRGSRATNNSGRGRKTASIRSRSASRSRAASSAGATTHAATRATPVCEPEDSAAWKNAPSSTPGMELSW